MSDVSLSSIANDNILVYTTNSGLNKWTNYTISGATFNDTNKTITISSSGALSGLSDCVLTSIVNGNLLVYNSAISKWINTDSIPDNLMFVYDDGDNTKKCNSNYLV